MALSLVRSAALSRPQVSARQTRRHVVVRAEAKPAVDIGKKVQEAVVEAEEACAKGTTQDCAVAWDTVEELSAAAAHKKVADQVSGASDPLEAFCKDAPDADECRVYED